MNFDLNLKAFLKDFPLKEMTGQQKYLAVAVLKCKGTIGIEIQTSEIKKLWRKTLLQIKFNYAFYDRAQQEGWVDPVQGKKGIFTVSQRGLDHLTALPKLESELNSGELKKSGKLIVVNRKATHSFDKYLRKILAEAKIQVLIADSWVDDTVFDNVLDVIPKTVAVKLVYAQSRGSFEQRARRFSTEYQKFSVKRYKHLHDRFVVVDDLGYVLGPSIKDAASNSPALVIELDVQEKKLLQSFFLELWDKGKDEIKRRN